MKIKKNIWIEYAIIAFVTLFSGLARYLLWDDLGLKGEFPPETIGFSFLFLVLSWEFFKGMERYLNRVLPYSKGLALRMAVQLLIGAVYMLIINRVLFMVAGKYLEGSLSVMFSMTTYATFATLSFLINSIFFGKYFFNEWKKSLLHAERLEREKTQVQFDNLKNQLNPHFLFNSLSSLHSLIIDQPALASEYVTNLSKVYRYVLLHENKSLVPLREELAFIGHFVFLLETRFGKGVDISIDIPEEAKNGGIVPVTLQILLENCIKHNAIDPEDPLRIEIKAEGQTLRVSNSIHPKVQVLESNGRGLADLAKLYSYLSPQALETESSPGKFAVIIPLIPQSS
ncbi:sensor histidine kinase [Mariniradius sediminis]|uniref:Histidine kinase n=1 Tax=Mariniradius sediminis TaxID=2909237 RepID=A0ABS9BRK7_9BACT|nr:sensor histidine kinase [Mariniradius sediminis]MCF1750196.1 histidine kinase [Mariniradius sediminis]